MVDQRPRLSDIEAAVSRVVPESRTTAAADREVLTAAVKAVLGVCDEADEAAIGTHTLLSAKVRRAITEHIDCGDQP